MPPRLAVTAGLLLASTPITRWLESLSGPWLFIAVAVLVWAETATLLFFIPGEFTLIFAGIASSSSHLKLAEMLVIAWVFAFLGDATGYALGHHYGERIKASRLGRKIGADNWHKAETLVIKRRGLIVLIGRWVGMLRAIMPATCGMSTMRYKDFLPWDVAGVLTWASACVVGGYTLGSNAEHIIKYIGYVATGFGVLVVIGWFARKKLHRGLGV